MSNLELNVIEPPYFSNWGDVFFPRLANKILPLLVKIRILTPNVITIISFMLYFLGSVSLFLNYPYHLIIAAIFFPLSYLSDCLDGQVARSTNQTSNIGDYLDKVLDVLKIYILTFSLGYALYLQDGNEVSLLFAFTACFFFNFRYYIKLETMINRINKEKNYLVKSRIKRLELYKTKENYYKKQKNSVFGQLKVIWYWNRTIIFVDEAEFVVFTALGAIFNRLDLTLAVLAISQILIATFRFFERGYQIHTDSNRLYWPMRK